MKTGAVEIGRKVDKCDVKRWSGDCRNDNYATLGNKYLCSTCGTIEKMDHEVRHETFSHVSGDYDNLS